MREPLFKLTLFSVSLTFILSQIARIPISGEVAIIALDILLGGIISGWLLHAIFTKKNIIESIKSSSLYKPLILFFSICLASLIVNSFLLAQDQLIVALLYLLRLVVYYSGFIVLRDITKKQKELTHSTMLYSGLLVVLLGYLQLLLYPDLRNLIYLGWDDHYYRMVSTFLDPNFLGLFLVLYFLFLLGVGRNVYSNKNKTALYIISSIALLTFVAIFLTYSRTAILALFVGLSIYLFQMKKMHYVFGVGIVMLLLLSVFANTKYESLNPFRTASIGARITASEYALTIIRDKPILGVGYNAYRYALAQHGFTEQGSYPHHGEAGTDNSFLFIMSTTGIIGLGSFLYLWGKVVATSRKNVVMVSSLTAFFVGSLFINALFYPFLLFWIIALYSTTLDNQR